MKQPTDYKGFLDTLETGHPPLEWPAGLRSLWYDAVGNWGASHDIAQEMNNVLGSWIHGYLHRKEGDDWNAGYWYRKAGRPFPKVGLEQEHRELVEYVLNGPS